MNTFTYPGSTAYQNLARGYTTYGNSVSGGLLTSFKPESTYDSPEFSL